MVNVTITTSTTDGGNSIGGSTVHTGSKSTYLNDDIADAASDQAIEIAFTLAQLKTFYMQADGDVTIETNSGGAPQETFVLTAGEAIVFREGDGAIFAGDITAMFATNSSGATVNLQIQFLIDATP